MDRGLLFAAGLMAAVAAAGAGTAAAIEDAGLTDAERARDEIFEVGPDCEWIRFRGLPEGVAGEQAVKNMELARDYFLVPRIEDGLAAGVNDPRDLALMILEELFPACTWPPKDLFSSHQLVYLAVAAWVTTTLEGMGVPVDDPVMPPQDAALEAPATTTSVTGDASPAASPGLTATPPAPALTSTPSGPSLAATPDPSVTGPAGPSLTATIQGPPAPSDEPFDSGFWSELSLGASPDEWVRTRLFEYGTSQPQWVNDDPIPAAFMPLAEWQRQYNELASAGVLPSYAGHLGTTGALDDDTKNAFQLVWEEGYSPQAWRDGLLAAA